MSEQPTRRELLKHTVRGAGLLGLGGAAVYLSRRAVAHGAWHIDPGRCVNSALDKTEAEVCGHCMTACVVPLSAVRAVNEYSRCGRCYICPAYFDVTSEVDEIGLPTKKICPRDAIKREPIGEVDPEDPANNFYEYVIDEELCDGCGLCVAECREPAGLGSIRLEVRHNLCVDCNRCAVSAACPEDALERKPAEAVSSPNEHHETDESE